MQPSRNVGWSLSESQDENRIDKQMQKKKKQERTGKLKDNKWVTS